MSTIKLNADQLDGEVTTAYGFHNGPKKDQPKDKNATPQEYRLLVFNNIVFRVEESVYQQWSNGELFDMTLIEGTYDKEQEDGTIKPIPSLTYSGSRTTSKVINRKLSAKKIEMIDSVTPENFKVTTESLDAVKSIV